MKLHIANFEDADRRTATALEAMVEGNVVYASGVPGGKRCLNKVTVTGNLKVGAWGVVAKFSDQALAVSDSTASVTDFGSRLITIVSGDLVVEVRRGAILEYSTDLLHPSITALNVSPGEELGILNAQWCKAATGSAIVSPVAGKIYGVRNGQIQIELVL